MLLIFGALLHPPSLLRRIRTSPGAAIRSGIGWEDRSRGRTLCSGSVSSDSARPASPPRCVFSGGEFDVIIDDAKHSWCDEEYSSREHAWLPASLSLSLAAAAAAAAASPAGRRGRRLFLAGRQAMPQIVSQRYKRG